jgi:hypothetical protein
MSDNIVILPKAERVAQWNQWVEQAPTNVRAYFRRIEEDAMKWEIAVNQEIIAEHEIDEVNVIYLEDV